MTVNFAGQKKTATVNKAGEWKVKLDAMKASTGAADNIRAAIPASWLATNARGRPEAITDYEAALRHAPESGSLINNLAWVLATSPDEKVRDAKRAVEFATKACELTKFEAPHILSTLAAAHAEAGDFDAAKKWSAKAVELGGDDEEQLKQLKDELKNYEAKKPWRELQDDPEFPERKKEDAPITPPELKDEVEI